MNVNKKNWLKFLVVTSELLQPGKARGCRLFPEEEKVTKQCSTPRQRFHSTRSVMRLLKMKSCVKRLMTYVPQRSRSLIPAPSTMSVTG